jgi:D-hydroxyproline dehydrogenase subunit alpha
MSEEIFELAVIGAGPAGMEAAISAAGAGVKTVIIDNYPQAGGQYYKATPPAFNLIRKSRTEKEGEDLARLVDNLPLTKFYNTLVWGIFDQENKDDWLVTLFGVDAPKQVRAKKLILANGAYDMPVAFPGWTLPGVITCGASLILVKTQRVAPGQRVLVTGSGPLLLSAAAHLIDAGVEVVSVCETSRLLPKGFRYIPTMLGQWHRLMEGAKYISTIYGHNTPYKTGWSIVEAHGKDHVEEAVIAKVDDNGATIAGTEQTVKVDTVVCGYGLSPNTELARLIGCELEYQSQKGGWVPVRDETMQTSISGVYAVGDGSGIGGAENSRIEGKIAGYSVALQTNHKKREEIEGINKDLQSKLAKQSGFGRLLGDLFALKPGLVALPHDDTLICRCEEIRKSEILAAIASGCDTVTWVKRMTRAGMGMCQGRTCGRLVAQLIAQQTGKNLNQLLPDTVRPPLRPIPLETLDQGS